MDKEDNPFEPGAGTRPQELVGRGLILEDAEAAIGRSLKGRPLRGQVFYGLRGVGKTVLLREVSEIVRKRGGLAADLETPEHKKLTEILVPAVRQLLLKLSASEQAKAALRQAAAAPTTRQTVMLRGLRRTTLLPGNTVEKPLAV
jgi:Cdc6-like AAA superfamily ATPase